jgi:hypothetical protein
MITLEWRIVIMIVYGYIPKSKKRKVTKLVKRQHDEWLASVMSMSTNFGKTKSKIISKSIPLPKVPAGRETTHYESLDTGFVGTLTKVGIMKDYHKMSKEDRAKVDAINSCVAPLHKSNYVYVSPGMNPAGFGRKNEIL